MNDWFRGIVNRLGLATAEDVRRIDADLEEAHRRVGTVEARIDVLELLAANLGHWPTRSKEDDHERR